MANTNKRIYYAYIDVLKVISSLMVITTHVVMHNIYVFGVHSLSWTILMIAKIITQFAVPCFFMISGAMLLSDPYEISYIDFIKRRFLKIIVPFLMWSFLYYVYFSFILNYYEFSLWDYAKRFLRQDISGHFWYMYALVTLYMLMPFLKKCIRNMEQMMIRTFIIILAIWGSIIPMIAEILKQFADIKLSLFTIGKMGVYLNYTIIGYYIHTTKVFDKRKEKLLLTWTCAMLLFQCLFTYFLSADKITQVWINITWLPVMIFSVFIFVTVKSIFNSEEMYLKLQSGIIKLAAKLAPLSFTAYLLHMLWLRTFQYLCPNDKLRMFVNRGGQAQFITVAEVFGAVILSYLSAFICKKIKYINNYL